VQREISFLPYIRCEEHKYSHTCPCLA